MAVGGQLAVSLTPSAGNQVLSAAGCPGVLQGTLYQLGPVTAACSLKVQFGAAAVSFADGALEAAVRKALGFSASRVITASDMAQLTELNVFQGGVKSLLGLETATNLRSLELTGNPLQDLAPLAGLRRLATLVIANTQVANLEPLKDVPLRTLSISSTPVTDLAPIASLKSLSRLSMGGTRVIDLEPLRRSSLGPGDYVDMGSSSDGCLYTVGYSRPLSDISFLRGRGVQVYFFDEKLRSTGCPNSFAQTQVSLQAEISSPTNMSLTWALTSADTGAWRCELHPDLTFQQPAEPLLRINDCPRSSGAEVNIGDGQSAKTFVVEDGLGGRISRTLAPTRGANAGPIDSITFAGFDFGQSVVKANPRLVANREALVRIHVLADQSQTAPAGTLTLKLGEQSQVVNLTKPATLPSLLQLTSLSRSYTAVVPAAWVQPGLSLQMQLANGLSRTLVPVVGAGSVLYLTLVPITSGGSSPQVPTAAAVERNLKTIWPLAQVVVRTHEPVDLSFPSADEGLAQLADLQAREGDTSYVFGLVSPAAPNFNVGGLAYVGGKVGLGLDATHDPSGLTMAHEIGHMFGLFHVNCGSPSGIQNDYPYPTTNIGSVGINYSLSRLILPNSASDIMSYCQPQHVSDFSYQRAQAHLEANPPIAFPATSLSRAAAAPQLQSFVVRGHLTGAGEWIIRQALPSPLPVEEAPAGDYSAEVTDAQGNSHTAPLRFMRIDHEEQVSNRHFSISLPVLEGQSLIIRRGDQVVFEAAL